MRILRPLIACVGFAAAAAAWMSSALVTVPIPVAPTLLFAATALFALGYLAGTPWAALALAFPVLFPLVAPGAIPENPDIPRYPELLALACAAASVPGALMTLAAARLVARRGR